MTAFPHLLSPVVTEPRKAIVALKWVVREMEDRYRLMSKLGVRNIEGYNLRVVEAAKRGERLTRRIQTGFDPETGAPIFEEEEIPLDPLPLIVVVVDEMADLMMVAGKDIEAAIQRLAQMARAAGIHLIMATQRPSVDVITGTIKANFPTRISFHVTSKIDSRTILGEHGRRAAARPGRHALHGPGRPNHPRSRPVRGRPGGRNRWFASLKSRGVPDLYRGRHARRGGGARRRAGARRTARRRCALRPGGRARLPRTEGLDQLRAAPSADRL